MIHKKRHTMFRRVAWILCGTAILQGIIFFSVMMGSDTFSSMTHDAHEMLEERVDYRRKEMQSILNDNVHDISIYEDVIVAARNIYAKRYEDIPISLDEEAAKGLIDVINSIKCSGAFIVLDEELMMRGYYPSVYLRDSEPSTIVVNNSDISARFGHSSVIKNLNITLDPMWTTSIHLDEQKDNSKFYFEPYNAAKTYTEYSVENLGYWSAPFRIDNSDMEIITYTMPLRDENNTVFGIIGLEFSTDYLASELSYEELDNSQASAYALGIIDEEKRMNNVLVSGPAYTSLKEEGIQLKKVDSLVYHVTNERDSTLGAVSTLSMYNPNTPFSNQQWVLLGMVAETALLSNVESLQQLVTLCIAFAIIAALIAALYASYRFATPIKQLEHHLKTDSHTGSVILPRVDILEIDNLSASIEELSKDVAYASSRLSQILQIVNIQVGAVEYAKHRDHVFCTEMVAQLLDLEFPSEYMTHDEFNTCIEAFKSAITYFEWESGNEHSDSQVILIKFITRVNEVRWIRLHMINREDEYLVVVNNVSGEMFEKKRLEHERDHDALTNLLNRRAFKEQVVQMLTNPEHTDGVLVMWDLDNLKYINDTYGHDMGDRYIRAAADILDRLPRDHAIVARMAGDEFLVYLHSYHSPHEYKQLISSLHKQMRESNLELPDQTQQPIRASAGVSWYPQDGEYYDDLLKHVDYAMYNAKNTIKGSIKEFNSSSYAKDKILISGKEELNQIIEENLVRYVYQPIVSARTGDIIGYEALMRPISNTITSPLDLLRLAKAQSKLYQIEKLTWYNVMRTYSQRHEEFQDRKIFINSIPNVTLYPEDLKQIEDIGGSFLEKAVIEIIESDDLDTDCMNLKQEFADKHHMQLAIDDFGSGYNNDGLLLKITPDYIKIDMSIIQGVSRDPDREQLVSNIIAFAHSKSALVIAEGIEDMPDLQVCIKLGVDLLQGYYLSEPRDVIDEIKSDKKKLIQSLKKVFQPD